MEWEMFVYFGDLGILTQRNLNHSFPNTCHIFDKKILKRSRLSLHFEDLGKPA